MHRLIAIAPLLLAGCYGDIGVAAAACFEQTRCQDAYEVPGVVYKWSALESGIACGCVTVENFTPTPYSEPDFNNKGD